MNPIVELFPTSPSFSGNMYTVVVSSSSLTIGTTYEFGVQTKTTFASMVEPSDVVWVELTYYSGSSYTGPLYP
jgi:hypothetical protein